MSRREQAAKHFCGSDMTRRCAEQQQPEESDEHARLKAIYKQIKSTKSLEEQALHAFNLHAMLSNDESQLGADERAKAAAALAEACPLARLRFLAVVVAANAGSAAESLSFLCRAGHVRSAACLYARMAPETVVTGPRAQPSAEMRTIAARALTAACEGGQPCAAEWLCVELRHLLTTDGAETFRTEPTRISSWVGGTCWISDPNARTCSSSSSAGAAAITAGIACSETTYAAATAVVTDPSAPPTEPVGAAGPTPASSSDAPGVLPNEPALRLVPMKALVPAQGQSRQLQACEVVAVALGVTVHEMRAIMLDGTDKCNAALLLASERHDIQALEWLFRRFNYNTWDMRDNDNRAVRYAMRVKPDASRLQTPADVEREFDECLATAKFIVNSFGANMEIIVGDRNGVIAEACRAGNFNAVRWLLVDRFPTLHAGSNAYSAACASGNTALADWLAAHEPVSTDYLFSTFAAIVETRAAVAPLRALEMRAAWGPAEQAGCSGAEASTHIADGVVVRQLERAINLHIMHGRRGMTALSSASAVWGISGPSTALCMAAARGFTASIDTIVHWLRVVSPTVFVGAAWSDEPEAMLRNLLADEVLPRACAFGHTQCAQHIVDLCDNDIDVESAIQALVSALANDHADTAAWLIAKFALTREDIVSGNGGPLAMPYKAAARYSFESLVWLDARYPLDAYPSADDPNAWLLQDACSSANIDAIRWLVARFGLTAAHVRDDDCSALVAACSGPGHDDGDDDDIYADAVAIQSAVQRSRHVKAARIVDDERRRLEIVKWLCSEFSLSKQDIATGNISAFRSAVASKYFLVASWLAQTYELTRTDILPSGLVPTNVFFEACSSGSVQLVSWFCSRFGITPEDIRQYLPQVLLAACSGSLDLIVWLCSTFALSRAELARYGTRLMDFLVFRSQYASAWWLATTYSFCMPTVRSHTLYLFSNPASSSHYPF